VKVLVLAGGLGTRLRSVFPGRPKALAPVHGRAFIDWQLELLAGQGFGEFVVCVGHRAEQIIDHLAAAAGLPAGVRVECSLEPAPLGTAGALRQAAAHLQATALVLNGDTYLPASYRDLLDRHQAFVRRDGALVTLTVVSAAEVSQAGLVEVAAGGEVLGFCEKPADGGGGLVSAGVYFVEPGLLRYIPESGPASLEREVFPALVRDRRLFAAACGAAFIDMGTPEGHARLVARLGAIDAPQTSSR
jgi:mannose-1-phosphate guanylyltransferase